MAITDFTLRLDNRFRCPTQASAGVRDKRAHTHLAMPWSRTPHVIVEAFIGTHDDMVNRTRAHGYTQHVPEAPCMLGADKTTLYRAAARKVDWGQPRYLAMAKASLFIGCAAMAVACLPLLGAVLVAKLGVSVGLTWPIAIHILASCYLGGAVGGAVYEARWYSMAKAKFVALATLSDGYDELTRGLLNEAKIATCEVIVNKSFDHTDWVLRQASLEYEAELQHRRPAAAEPEKAAA